MLVFYNNNHCVPMWSSFCKQTDGRSFLKGRQAQHLAYGDICHVVNYPSPYICKRSFAEGSARSLRAYIDSIIIQRSQENHDLKNLRRHKSVVLRIDTELYAKPTSLKSAVGMRLGSSGSCGAYSVIGEFTSAQKHCLHKFINLCMKHGKKNKSYKIISTTLQRLIHAVALSSHNPSGSLNVSASQVRGSKQSCGSSSDVSDRRKRQLFLLMNAIENVKPIVEVKKVRISGTTQLVPCIIPKNRQICLALRWIVEAAILRRNTKKSMTLDQCFFAELIDASRNIGAVRKRRDDLHKLAESNRGFAHYRWW